MSAPNTQATQATQPDADAAFKKQARRKQTSLTDFGVQVKKTQPQRKKRKCTLQMDKTAARNAAGEPAVLYGVEVAGNDEYSDPNDSDFDPESDCVSTESSDYGTDSNVSGDGGGEDMDAEVVLVDVIAPENAGPSQGSKGSSRTAKGSKVSGKSSVCDDEDEDCCLFRPVLFRKWCSEFRWLQLRYASSQEDVPREEWDSLEGANVSIYSIYSI